MNHKRPVHLNRGRHGHVWVCLECGKQLKGPKLPADELEACVLLAKYLTQELNPQGSTERKSMQTQVNEAMKHFGKGFAILAEAFQAAGLGNDPQPTTGDAVGSAKAVTEKARKAADKKAPKQTPVEETTETDTPAETPATPEQAAPAKAPKKEAAKKNDDNYESLGRDEKIEHLRSRMVLVAQKNGGDREKTYAYLKKYKATKVNELSDENLDNLKNDIEVFLAGPDALDI